jgi:UDP-glucose 4-epimerase
VPVVEGPRRAGDAPRLVADARKAKTVLGWQPARSALPVIVADAWRSMQPVSTTT